MLNPKWNAALKEAIAARLNNYHHADLASQARIAPELIREIVEDARVPTLDEALRISHILSGFPFFFAQAGYRTVWPIDDLPILTGPEPGSALAAMRRLNDALRAELGEAATLAYLLEAREEV